MAPKNKLYTRSYVVKRLKENNIRINILDVKYIKNDIRYWTVLVNPSYENIFLTCCLNQNNKEDYYFKLHSFKNTITIKTKSVRILVDYIKNLIDDMVLMKSNDNSIL